MTNDEAKAAATAATRTDGQTGPRTEAGLESPSGVRAKAKSSRNAIRTGLESPSRGESLYAARDFVRPEEEEEYAQTLIKLMDELTPDGTVEQTFATEIMGATWRLRRCRSVEEAFGLIEDLDFDPMVDERTEKQQKSVDRARAQSHLILRRSLDELRKLQKVRIGQNPAPKPAAPPRPDAGPPNMDALMALAEHQLAQRYRESGLNSFCNPVPAAPAAAPAPSPVTPAVPRNTPRNAPCPCRSGAKFKKCCGNPAAPARSEDLNKAA